MADEAVHVVDDPPADVGDHADGREQLGQQPRLAVLPSVGALRLGDAVADQHEGIPEMDVELGLRVRPIGATPNGKPASASPIATTLPSGRRNSGRRWPALTMDI